MLSLTLVACVVVAACTADNTLSSPATSTGSASSPTTTAPALVTTEASVETTTPTTTTTSLPEATTYPPATTGPHRPPPVGEPGFASVISQGDPSRLLVALTFDAGADTGFAAEILDILASNGIRGSFGLTGAWAEQNPGLVARIVADGHQLINHTYDHASFTGRSTRARSLTSAERHDQLARTDAAIRTIAGTTTAPWFRPPYGDYDESVNADVFAAGYTYNVLWTIDSLGWMGYSSAQITDRCLRRAVAGAIYLFHVGSRSQDAASLQAIIDGLRAQGYGFVTVAGII